VLEGELRDALTAAAEPVQGLGVRKEQVRAELAKRRRKQRLVRYAAAAALAGAAALAVAFIVPRGDDQALQTTDDPNPPAPVTTAEPDAPVTTGGTAPSTTGTSVETTDATESLSTTSSTSSTTSSTTSTTGTPPLPAFPPQGDLNIVNGDRAWGVFMTVRRMSPNESPEEVAAHTAAAEAGYRTSTGGTQGATSLGCDQGAGEALGYDVTTEPWYTVAVYFLTQADAEGARAAFEARGFTPVGVAPFTASCRD
jgi:hypothetical protein